MSSVLKNQKILLGITGGIAAYKAAYLVRLFKKSGAEVQVVMTPSAHDFCTPLTLATLSQRPVLTKFVKDDTGIWNHHVDLALWADLIVIAPATANTLSKMAYGQCDNLLMAIYFSAKCPVWVAPAMDLDMYRHPTFLESLQRIENHGVKVIPAENGFLASGLEGEGRMAEPEHIVALLEAELGIKPLSGKKVLITAGPTYEAIDPVRFIGNHSTGLMGFELAKMALKMGAQVSLITGPSTLQLSHDQLELIRVQSAVDMQQAVMARYADMDIAIASAAVADYRPAEMAVEKIKKTSDSFTIELVKNPDILAEMGKQKTRQYLVGFALETQNEIFYATQKLKNKNLDLIVLNSLRDEGAGFGTQTNKVTLIETSGEHTELPLLSKEKVAYDIFQKVLTHLS
ncbi:MAG: phosphopantothenoylcysteine decarboxylase [Flavobacterium sp. BFFFF2]|nr:MAG: phosphopantothenoylcysteine decarboxylase [Flavobacterium sp. BFFFF2]